MNVSAGRRPLYGLAVNQQPAPSFDGTNDYLQGNTLKALASASSYHVFVVARFDSITLNGPFPFNNHNIVADESAAWTLAVGTPGLQAMHWDTANRATSPIPVQTGIDYLIEWSFDGATIRCRVGGGATETVGAADIVSTDYGVRLGFGYAGAGYLSGCIASVICSSQYLSGSDAQNVRAYLSTRYGVPA